MRAVPIRIRLTMAFAAIMCAVLAATGLFVFERVRSSLNAGVRQSLRTHAADVAAIARQSDTALGEASSKVSDRPAIAELVSPSGRVLDTTPGLRRSPLMSRTARAAAFRGRAVEVEARVAAIGVVRLLAQATNAQDQRMLVIVGQPLQARDTALAELREELIIGGSLALVVSCAVGYLLTAAALRPVEALRRRAAALSTDDLAHRLAPVAANDELGRLQRTLDEMLERIHAAVQRERTFVSDASHELRSPLTSLRAELELLALEQPQGQRLERALASAVEETERLSRVTQGLLTLARADDGQLPVSVEPTRASLLMQRAAGLALEDAQRRGVDVSVAEDATAVLADPELVAQALHDLLANAVRHAAGKVRVDANAAGEMLELHVRDDGPGFPEGFLPRAWDRFARADGQRTEGGAGLGLAIVRTVASAHGGSTGARNTPGAGADVWISLPRVRVEGAPMVHAAPESAGRQPGSTHG